MSAYLRHELKQQASPLALECLFLLASLGPMGISDLTKLTRADEAQVRRRLRLFASWVPEGAEQAVKPRAPLLKRRRLGKEDSHMWLYALSATGEELLRAWTGGARQN